MFKVKNYEIHPELYYDQKEHLWIKVDGNRARIGIDPLEQETKGAFVVIQLDSTGSVVQKGESFGSLEAEKHVGTLRSPVSGKVATTNPAVLENPRLANTDPYHDGWFIELELSNFDEEKKSLLTGKDALKQWYETEIKKYEEWGWLAES